MSTICMKLSCIEHRSGTDPSLHLLLQHIFSANARFFLYLGHFFFGRSEKSAFEQSEKAFFARIVIRTSRRAHGALNAVFSQHTFVCSTTVLTSSVTMEYRSLVSSAKSQGISQRPFAQFAVDVFAHFIADHLFVFQIQNVQYKYVQLKSRSV